MASSLGRVVAALAVLELLGPAASGQTPGRASFGAGVTLAWLPQPEVGPDGVFPYVEAPHGKSTGLDVFGGVALSRRFGLEGELSVASPATLTTFESHPSTSTTRTIQHRDTILVGLMRVRAARFIHLLAGGGCVFPRTSLTVTGSSRTPSGTVSYGPLTYLSPTNDARLALTVGADLLAPLNDHLAIVGLLRLHHLSRAEPLRSEPFGRIDDPRPFVQPDTLAIRLGAGVRITL